MSRKECPVGFHCQFAQRGRVSRDAGVQVGVDEARGEFQNFADFRPKLLEARKLHIELRRLPTPVGASDPAWGPVLP